jgi:hypothetical protein
MTIMIDTVTKLEMLLTKTSDELVTIQERKQECLLAL